MFDFGKAETVGKRSNQEDSCEFIVAAIPPADNVARAHSGASAIVAALADGMGGHVGGQVASQTAIAGFKSHYGRSVGLPPHERLYNALIAANEALAETRRRNTALEGMGSTFIAAAFENSSLRWVSVGDSILYLYRDGELTRLNADHSMAPELDRMAARNEITPERARRDPMRHALRSALTGDALQLIDQRAQPFPLLNGDWIVIASDGIETLNEAAIKGCIEKAAEHGAQAVAEQLIAAVDAAGDPRQDNTTVMTVHVSISPRYSGAGNGSIRMQKAGRGHPSLDAIKALAFGCTLAAVIIVAVIAFNISGSLPENGVPAELGEGEGDGEDEEINLADELEEAQ